tara:strand:+ start:7071 stop:7736 length:666 start_codon:yes stop_codon:yes gene_type:complete
MKTTKSASDKDHAAAAKIVRSAMKREKKIAAATEQTTAARVDAACEPGLAEAIAITQAAAKAADLPTIPEVPAGATHFRLTRKFLEIAADVRHLASDLAALGTREGDVIEFGTMTAAGTFTTNARALAKTTGTTRIPGKMALIDSMIVLGTHTARAVAAECVAKFGGELEKTLVIVRSRPWHLKKADKLAADAVPFAKAVSNKAAAKVAKAAARAAMEYGN